MKDKTFIFLRPPQGAPGHEKEGEEGRKERKEEREKVGEVLYELIWEYNSVISVVMHFFSLFCLVCWLGDC